MSFRVFPLMPSIGCRRCLHRVGALGIGLTYGFTYLLVSSCLATGVFHPSIETSPVSHPHAETHTHDHHHERASDTPWLDICDYALQVLLASAWLPKPQTVAVWVPGEAIPALEHDAIWPPIPADLSIRSPPCMTAV